MIGFIRKAMSAVEQYQKRRVAYWQLNNLTDQELHDIGISRDMIREVVYGI